MRSEVGERLAATNVLQQRWCEELLTRAPRGMTRLRAQIEGSRAWLASNPDRALGIGYRERLLRYEAMFAAEDAARGLIAPPRPRAPRASKPDPQLELLLGPTTKFDRRPLTTQT